MPRQNADLWVEVASPIKNPLKEAFFDYAKKVYEKDGTILTSYFPSLMGGDMLKEDYLVNMKKENIPENYFCMSFGESSSQFFHKKLIEENVFRHAEIAGWFCETMVIDKKRLENRPLPKSYFDLINPVYKGEVSIIGTKELPDPLLPLFIKKKLGEGAMKSFLDNLSGIAPPVNAIRHIGKTSNSFGSVFIMPLYFANICKEIKDAVVIRPEEGYLAESFVLFSKNPESKKTRLIQDFIHSKAFENVFSEKEFLVSNKENDKKIFPLCKEIYFEELEDVYPELKKRF